jgi:hypothetical protein
MTEGLVEVRSNFYLILREISCIINCFAGDDVKNLPSGQNTYYRINASQNIFW